MGSTMECKGHMIQYCAGDDMTSGRGKITHSTGKVYTGDILGGRPHGRGRMISTSWGVEYEGQWKGGREHGRGKMTERGIIWEGNWERGKMHGRHKVRRCSFGYWIGVLLGNHNNEGEVINVLDDCKLNRVEYCADHGVSIPVDKVEYCSVHDSWICASDFNLSEYKMSGMGKITYSSGDVYEGGIIDGKPHGEGKMTFLDGSEHEGEWMDGRAHGKGKVTMHGTTTHGMIMQGTWKEGEIVHDRFTVMHSDGFTGECEWN